MFSPKAFLHDLITKNLSEWVENIQEDSFHLGLLEGDIQLSNLAIKKKTWGLNQNLSLSLEYGTIEKFSAQVPWLQLHTGQVNIFVDTVILIFRINVLDHDKSGVKGGDNFTHELKMDLLQKEELRLSDEQGTGPNAKSPKTSWMSRSMTSVLNTFISKIASNFNLTATNIKVSLLLPLPQHENALLKLNVKSLVVSSDISSADRNRATASAKNSSGGGLFEFFLTKDVQIHGLSVTLNRVVKPTTQRDFVSLSKNKSHDIVGVLLNPCNSSTQVFGRKDKNSESYLQNLNTLSVQLSVSNMEWTPSCDQLFLLKDVVSHLEQEEIKFRYQAIRALILKKPSPMATGDNTPTSHVNTPAPTPGHQRTKSGLSQSSSRQEKEKIPFTFNPREVWLFAIRAILVMVKERNSGGKFTPQLRSGMERLGLRRQYLALYRKVMDAKLSRANGTNTAVNTALNAMTTTNPTTNNAAATASVNLQSPHVSTKSTHSHTSHGSHGSHAAAEPKEVLEIGLSSTETKKYAELHGLFSLSDLVLFRATVLQEYQNKGVSSAELRRALTNKHQNTIWSRWFGGRGGPSSKQAEASGTCAASDSFASSDAPIIEENNSFTFELKGTLSRLSITIYDNPLEPHHPNNRVHASDGNNLHYSTPATSQPARSSASYDAKTESSRKNVRRHGGNFSIKTQLQSRVGQTIRATPGTAHTSTSAHAGTMADALVLPKQCFSLVLYGIHTSFEWAGDNDKIVVFSLGSLKCFGHKGAEIVSCGGDPNYWLEYNFLDAQDGEMPQQASAQETDTNKALSLSLKWCHTAVMTSLEQAQLEDLEARERSRKHRRRTRGRTSSNMTNSTNDDTGSTPSDTSEEEDETENEEEIQASLRKARTAYGLTLAADKYTTFDGDRSFSASAMSSVYKNLMRASNKHLVVEISVSYLHLTWHRKSALFITDLYFHLAPSSSQGSSTAPFQGLKDQGALLSYYRAARGIVDVPAKVSIEASARGLTIQVPIQGGEAHGAPQRRNSKFGAGTFTAPRKPFEKNSRINMTASQANMQHQREQETTAVAHHRRYVQLSIGKISLAAGDYLTGYLTVPRPPPVPQPEPNPDDTPRDPTADPSGEYDPDALTFSERENYSSQVFNVDSTGNLEVGSAPPSTTNTRRRPHRRASTSYDGFASESIDPLADEAPEDPPFVPLTSEEKIRELVLALRNGAVRPMAFSVANFELCIVGNEPSTTAVAGGPRSENSLHQFFLSAPDAIAEGEVEAEDPTDEAGNVKRMLTAAPWMVHGVISPSVVPANSAFTQLRVDLICSPFKMLLSTEDIISLIDMAKGMAAVCAPVVADVTAGPVAPRIRRLSPLSCLFLDVEMEEVGIEFLVARKGSNMSNSSAISAALRTYGTLVQARGRYSYVALSRRPVVCSQLRSLGVEKADALAVLTRFENDVVESRHDVDHIADLHTMGLYGKADYSSNDPSPIYVLGSRSSSRSPAPKANSERVAGLPDTCRAVLFHLRIFSLRFLHHSLTYDQQNLVTIGSLILYDKERVPLLTLSKDLSDRLEHFPHLDKEAAKIDDLPGIDLRSGSGRSARRRDSTTSSRRDSASLHSRSQDRVYPRDRRNSNASRRSRRFSSARDSPPDTRYSRNSVCDNAEALESSEGMFITPSYVESFRIDRYASTCALALKYEEKDINEHFGEGGWGIDVLYKPMEADLYGVRDGFVTLNSRQVEIQFCTSSILQIIQQAVAAASVVRSHYADETPIDASTDARDTRKNTNAGRKRSSSAHFYDPTDKSRTGRDTRRRRSSFAQMAVSRERFNLHASIGGRLSKIYVHQYLRRISLKADLGALTVVLSSDKLYLAQLSIYRVTAAVQDLLNLEGARTVTAAIHSLSLLDLSDAGALHSEVLWKNNDNQSLNSILEGIKAAEKDNINAGINSSNSEYLYRESSRRINELFKHEKARIDDSPPVIALSFTQSETIVQNQKRQKLLLNVEVDALRVTFLFRFILDCVVYFKDKLIVPLKASLESLDETARRMSAVPAPFKYASQDSDISEASYDSDIDLESTSNDSASEGDNYSWSNESVSDDEDGPARNTRFARRGTSQGTTPAESSGNESGVEPEEKKMEVLTNFELVLSATDLAGVVPRSSSSRDLIGLKIREGLVRIGFVADSFPLPSKDGVFPGLNPVESDAEIPLHLDIATNSWRFKPSLATVRAKSRIAAQSNLDALMRRSFSPTYSTNSRLRERALSGTSLNSGHNSGNGSAGGAGSGAATVSSREGVEEKEQKDVFADANLHAPSHEWSNEYDHSSLKDWGDNGSVAGGSRWRPSLSGGLNVGGESTWWLHDDEEERERLFCLEELANNDYSDNFDPKDCLRISASVTGARAFVTFAGPSNYKKEEPYSNNSNKADATPMRKRSYSEAPSNMGGFGAQPLIDTTEHKIFTEIADGGLVNKFRRKAGGNVGVWPVNQAWREVTLQEFNLVVVIDFTGDDKLKLLFGDTAEMSTLKVKASQSEFYLLLDLWFSNCCELPQFGIVTNNNTAASPQNPVSPPALSTPGASLDHRDRESGREKETVRFNVQTSDSDAASPRSSREQAGFVPVTPPNPHRNGPHLPDHFSKYGSKEYLQFLRERFTTFEIVVMLAEVNLLASLDTNYYTRDLPNQAATAGMVPTDSGTAYTHHMGLNAHHHHHRAQYSSVGRTPKGGDDKHASSASKVRSGGSGEDKMNFSFYNIPVEPHTPSFGKKAFMSRWVNKHLQLADIRLSGAMLHVQSDHDVLHLSVGAGKAEVYDMRHPQQICTPLALRVAPSDDPTTSEHVQNSHNATQKNQKTKHTPTPAPVRRRVYGYSDLNFGFNLVPSSMYTAPDLPLKMSLLNSHITNFLTLNVGMDLLDLNINNLDLVNLVSDYFSCYFRFPDYGHTVIQSYDRLTAPYIIPYGGVDTRVFVFRPHVAMLKAAMNLQSPALLLETDGGVYFRYTLDSDSNVKMDLNIFSLAVILVKRYRAPSQYRGIRGSSGSGKGVRTLIEFLSIGMAYHFLVSGNNLDLKFFISGPENDDEEVSEAGALNESTAAVNLNNEQIDTYVDLSDEKLRLGSSAIPHPHSVFPLVPSRTDFTPHSCDVVASYEDLTFCVSLVNKFLNIKAAAKSRREKKKEKKRRENMDDFERARADSKDSVAESEKEMNLVKPFAIFGVVSLAGLRLMVVDNVLGLHLPLVQVFLEEVQCTFVRDDHANLMIACANTEPVDRTSHLPFSLDSARDRNTRRFSRDMSRRFSEAFRRDSLTVELVRLKNIAQYQLGLSSTPSMYTTGGMLDAKAFAKQEVMTFAKFTVWAEYFNNMRKCWEPLLEKLVATVLYEKSLLRGTGLTVRTASAVHANISGAFFRTLNDILTTLRTHRGGKENGDEGGGAPDSAQAPAAARPKAKRGSIHVPETTDHDYQYDDHHQHELGAQHAPLTNQHSLEKKKSDRMSLDRNGRPWSQRRKSRYSESFTRRSSINKDMGDDASSQNSGATVQRKLDHVPSNPLSANFRVGFSIQNLTGQPVRYLQQWEGGRRTVQYINNNERGLLNFVASKTLIRNNQVIEETFDVQMELSGEHYGARNRRKAVGNRVALQVSGYRWLHAVQADELGVHYEELYSVLGRVHASQVYKNWKVVNSLKLMVEVMPYAGGRMLRLRSVFTIKNNTRHRLKILAKEGNSASGIIGDNDKSEDSEAPFLLESGENFYVPLALLRRSVLASQGKSLGYLYLCPADLSSIEEELVSRPNSQPGSVEYTTDPINLYQTVSKSSEMENEDPQRMAMDGDLDFTVKPDRLLAKDNYTQLVCHINPKIKGRYGNGRKSGAGDWQNNTDFQQQVDVRRTAARAALNKLPPFCYCVEVQSGTDYTNSQHKGASQGPHGGKNSFFSNMMYHNPKLNSPVNFTITIHPPIVLENLLPCSGIFELVHATQKRVLWSSFIAAGTAKPVHTVTLEEPLLLLINLKYCRSSEGALIHQPRRFESSEGIVGKMQRTLEGLLEDTTNLGGEGSEDITSIVLTDTVGQRIRVNVENTLGGGGQRQIAVYCPYWVVNTSQYSLRIMEDGTNVLPAGTVTAQKDGTRPVPHSGSAFAEIQARNAQDQESLHNGGVPNTLASPSGHLSPSAAGAESFHNIGQKKTGRADANVGGAVFPGCYGPLHSVNNREFAIDSTLGHQLQELSFNDTVDLSYMFNYIEPQGRLNKKRVKVQLDDTTWSRPFSLDSVGVDQMLTVNDHIRGCMEMGFKIAVAPGRLAKYTKIVRFLPRFSVVNKLPVNLKILQPTGFAGEAAEVEVSAERVRPYHLPAMFGERQITLQLEGGWHRSVVFNIDQIGVFNMEVKRRINLATIQHVNTRGAPEYTEVFPALRTLGLYFETDWGEENIVVKSFQKGSYASTKTDIKVGDVLLSIDDEHVDGKQFELAMVLLRNKLSADGCVVKFRTVEEKIRLIRESALNSTVRSHRAKRRIHGPPGTAVGNSGSHNASMPDLDTHDDVSTAAHHEGDYAGHQLRLDMDTDIGVLEERIQASRHSLQASSRERAREKDRIVLRVELRQVEASAMILVQELGPKVNAEYRIENKSVCYKLYYKQKGIAGNSWMMLNPGQSRSYVWEDPFQPHKLLVHSGDNVLSPSNNLAHVASEQAGTFLTKRDGEGKYWGYLAGRNADQATVVNLDEIGSKETLFVSKQTDLKMVAMVKSEGPTKILLITPSLENRQVIRELRYTSEFINQQLNLLNQLLDKLTSLAKFSTVGQLSSKLALLDSQFEDALVRMKEKQTKLLEVDEALNSSGMSLKNSQPQPRGSFGGKKGSPGAEEPHDAKPMLPLTSLLSFKPIERVMDIGIDRQHQLEISVLEAKELTALVAGKREDVYVKVVIKAEDLTVMTQSRYNKIFRTYVCDSTLDPTWLEQKTVFDVPEKAVLDQRKYNVKVLVKARSIVGLDTTLGQTDIEFSCLKEERPLEGWFPLRAVRSSSVLSLKVSGSIKLRLQWVHSPVGFAHYMCRALEERQQYLKLQYNVQRFSLKHLQKVESNKSLTAKNDKIQRMQLRQAEKDYYELFEALSDREKASKIGPAPFQALLLQQSQKVPALGLNMGGISMDIESELTPVFPGGSNSGNNTAHEHTDRERSEDEKQDDHYESDHELGKNLQLDDFIGNRSAKAARARALRELNASSGKSNESIMSPIVTTDLHSPMHGGFTNNNTHGHGPIAHSEQLTGGANFYHSGTKSALKDSKFRPPKINVTTPSNSVGRNTKFRRGLSSKFDEEGSSHALKPMPNAVHEHDDHHHAWAIASLNNIPVHQAMAESMDRSEEVISDHQAFCRRFDQECRRSFEHVHTMTGTLEVTPMQALHLPEAKNPMLVRVAYGDQRHSTFRLPPASYLTWYQEQDTGAGGTAHGGLHNPDFAENGGSSAHTSFNRDRDSSELNSPIGAAPPQRDNSQNATLAKTFAVDTLNIKGALNVFIMTEGVLKAQEVAKIEIPMFNLLDCCFALPEGQYYDRWFPLILSSESMPCEGDVDRYMNNIIPEQSAYSSFDYQPCVRLRVRWIHSENRHQIEESRLYARFQVPSVSFGLIDSVYAREVMQVAIRGIEFRHSVATDYTDSSLNITSMQVDNQLPDPVSAVILCPTRVKHPQPVVRMHVRKKNLLSQHHLTSYETIQLVVQELDLHLEQQTVIASWELVKSLMQERKYGKQQSQAQNTSADKISGEGGTTNMDLLGFATCTALVQYELLPTLSETFGKKQSSKNAEDKKESTLNQDEDVNTLYIEHFEIFPIKVNVSFITTPQVNLAPQQKKQRETDIRREGTTGMYSSVSLFLWQVGEVVLDLTSTISDAPIFFHGYEESHVFKTDHEIARFLQDRYLHYAMWQLYKIVGSLELVGNPIGLLSSLGSGVRDFFYEPAHAIITSPTEIRKIGAGLVKGAVSLVSNTTVGFLGTGITITRSIGRGVAKLSMDSAYMRRREELQRVPATVKAAAKRPFLDFYNGFYYGLVGVVKIPVKTVRRRGAIGVVPGVAKGLLGLATNPVVGTLDAIAHAGDACRDMLNLTIKESAEPVLRLRLSELFGPDGRILPYSFSNALGTQILLVLDRSKEERIKVSNAINSGVGMLHSVFSRSHGDTISMSIPNNPQSARLSVMNDRRGSLLRHNSRGEPMSVSGKTLTASGKGNMVQRKNRFSFHTTNEEEAVLRSDMGMFAHTMSGGADDASVDSDGDKDHHKAPVASEFVIYTAIIKQDRNLDLVTILTTERIIVTEYHRRPNSAYLKEQWVSPLSNVQVPIFERSGGKATLLLRSSSAAVAETAATAKKMNADAVSGRSSISELPDSSNGPHSPVGFTDASSHIPLNSQHSSNLQNGKKASNYLLVANYNEEDVIINLHNCILAVRGYFDGLMPTYIPEHNDCEEKEQNVIHIGPWQFARDAAENPNNYGQSLNAQMDTKAAETQAIIKELELEVWVHWKKPRSESRDKSPFALQLGNKNRDLDAPLWLTAEQEAAVQSHSNIRHIFELCNRLYEEYKRQPRSKYLLKVSIQELYKGGIDYETFMKNTQPALMPPPTKPVPADDDSVDSTATGKKAKSRFSLFPFVLGNGGGIASANASVSGVESTGTKRSHIISFNLPRGMGGKADENKSAEDAGNAPPSSPVPGFTGPPENEDLSAFGVMSDISSRLTHGAMTIGAAALALPSTLAYSMARSNSPAPTGTTKVKEADHTTDRIVEGEGEEVLEVRASTRIPFGLTPLDSSEHSSSWDTMGGTPHGDLNNLNNLFSTREQRQKEKEASEFIPTIVSANSSVSGQSVASATTPPSQSADTSFTYADLKPNRRRHSSPKLATKNSVRWSTGNLNGGGNDGSREELETIQEGTNERPSSKSRASRFSTGSAEGIASPEMFLSTRTLLSGHSVSAHSMSARSKGSSFDTDDEALFFDALSPTDQINESFDDFESYNKIDESEGFEPLNLADGEALGGQDSRSRSQSESPRDPLMLTSPLEEGNNVEGDEASNISTASSQIGMDNPMFHRGGSTGTATLLASGLAGGHTTHPLRRKTSSFGRPTQSSENSDSFFSPISNGVVGGHRRSSFGLELVAREAASGVPTGYVAPHQTPIASHHRTPSSNPYQSPTTVQSPEMAAMAERLERLESLLVQALSSRDTTPLQARPGTAAGQSSSVERPGSADRHSFTHQLSTSFAQFVAPMLGMESEARSPLAEEGTASPPDTLSRSNSSHSHDSFQDNHLPTHSEEGFGDMDYFSPTRDASLTISSKRGDPVSDADFDAWERTSRAWATEDPVHSSSTDASFPTFERAAESTETFRSGFLMSSSDDDSFRPTGVREPTFEMNEISEGEEEELGLMREEDCESAVREGDEARGALDLTISEEAPLVPRSSESAVYPEFALSVDTNATFDLSSSDGTDAVTPEQATSSMNLHAHSQLEDEPSSEKKGDEAEEGPLTLAVGSANRHSLPLIGSMSTLSESPMPEASEDHAMPSGGADATNHEGQHKPIVRQDDDVSPQVVSVTPGANGHSCPEDATNGHTDALSPGAEQSGHKAEGDKLGEEEAAPTSPSVAVLIDRFSSPLIARSSDRESRRLSRRRDSTG